MVGRVFIYNILFVSQRRRTNITPSLGQRLVFVVNLHHCFSINGVPACANTQLLTTIARKEWGFTGYVVSDDLAIPMIQAGHNYTNTTIQTAIAAIRAGCNMELGSKVYMSQLDAVKQGEMNYSGLSGHLFSARADIIIHVCK